MNHLASFGTSSDNTLQVHDKWKRYHNDQQNTSQLYRSANVCHLTQSWKRDDNYSLDFLHNDWHTRRIHQPWESSTWHGLRTYPSSSVQLLAKFETKNNWNTFEKAPFLAQLLPKLLTSEANTSRYTQSRKDQTLQTTPILPIQMHEGQNKHAKLQYTEKRNTCVIFRITCSLKMSNDSNPPHRFIHRRPAHLKKTLAKKILYENTGY